MASISKPRYGKDGKPTWYVLYRLNGKQTSQPFADYREAVKFKTEIDHTAPFKGGPTNPAAVLKRHGIITEPIGGPTVEEYVELWIDTVSKAAPGEKVKYRAYLKNDIAPAFGGMRLRKVDFADITEWLAALEEIPNSPKTVINKWVPLNGALGLAVKRGVIPAHPCAMEDRFLPDDVPTRKRILRLEEFNQLCGGFNNEETQLFVKFLMASGCRFSEATALEPGDVDAHLGTAYIHQDWIWVPPALRTKAKPDHWYLKPTPKTPTSTRNVYVSHEMIERLKDAGMLDPARAFVFLNEDGGPIRQTTFGNRWSQAVERSGLGGRKPKIKDLRATFASVRIKNKTDPLVLQKQMGHSNIKTTLALYAEYDVEEATLAAAYHGKWLFGAAK